MDARITAPLFLRIPGSCFSPVSDLFRLLISICCICSHGCYLRPAFFTMAGDLHQDVLEVRTLSVDHLRMLRYCDKPPSSNKMRTKIERNTNELYAADLQPRNNRHRLSDAQYTHCIGPVSM